MQKRYFPEEQNEKSAKTDHVPEKYTKTDFGQPNYIIDKKEDPLKIRSADRDKQGDGS